MSLEIDMFSSQGINILSVMLRLAVLRSSPGSGPIGPTHRFSASYPLQDTCYIYYLQQCSFIESVNLAEWLWRVTQA
jgi:hypothetical protein